MHLYENITIINPGLTDEEINATIEKTLDIIKADGGEILKVDTWGRRKLAYELNKHDKGHYTLILFRAPGESLAKIETAYKVNEQIIKYMTVRLEKKQEKGTLKALEDAAKAAEAAEAKAAEPPATEAPATEAPATEAPATEAPATEAPATEAPATEAPATEAPAAEAPATETPAAEAPATEAPSAPEPTSEG